MSFGANLQNIYNELAFTTEDTTLVYRGWVTPYYTKTVNTRNYSYPSGTVLEYIVPLISDGMQIFLEEVNFLSGSRNQVPIQTVLKKNLGGYTSLVVSGQTGTVTSTVFNFVQNASQTPYRSFPGNKATKQFVWVDGSGNTLSGNYASECVVAIGDVAWCIDNPSNTATVTSVTSLSSNSSTNSNVFQITFSNPLTFTASTTSGTGASTTATAYPICLQKLVNTTFVRVALAMPPNKMGEWRYGIRVFTPIESNTTSGYGMQTFDSTGKCMFDTNQSPLVISGGVTIPSISNNTTKSSYSLDFGTIPDSWMYTGTSIGVTNIVNYSYDDNYFPWWLNGPAYGLGYSYPTADFNFTGFYRIIGCRKESSTSVILDTTGTSINASNGDNSAPIGWRQLGGHSYLYADSTKYPMKSSNRLNNIVSRGTTYVYVNNYSQDSDPPPSNWPPL